MEDNAFEGDLRGFLNLLLAHVAVDLGGFIFRDLIPALPAIFPNECSLKKPAKVLRKLEKEKSGGGVIISFWKPSPSVCLKPIQVPI